MRAPRHRDHPFVILSIDPEKKRIGVALVPEGSARSAEWQDSAAPDRFGSLADKLHGALNQRKK